jgi:hypothetical protein
VLSLAMNQRIKQRMGKDLHVRMVSGGCMFDDDGTWFLVLFSLLFFSTCLDCWIFEMR